MENGHSGFCASPKDLLVCATFCLYILNVFCVCIIFSSFIENAFCKVISTVYDMLMLMTPLQQCGTKVWLLRVQAKILQTSPIRRHAADWPGYHLLGLKVLVCKCILKNCTKSSVTALSFMIKCCPAKAFQCSSISSQTSRTSVSAVCTRLQNMNCLNE